ncbi:hypothetical protein D3C77_520560 [compost metagenome]
MGVRARGWGMERGRRDRRRLPRLIGDGGDRTPTPPSPLEGEGFLKSRPRPAPAEAQIGVAGVFQPSQPPRRQIIPQRLAALVQHRAHQHQPAPLGPGGRRRPVAQASQRRALGPHPLALDDVVGRVAGQDHARARRSRRLGQQGVARRARARRGAGSAARAFPDERPPVGARRARRRAGEPGPGRAVGMEGVIDRQGQQAPPPRPRPGGGQLQQGQGVAPARQG